MNLIIYDGDCFNGETDVSLSNDTQCGIVNLNPICAICDKENLCHCQFKMV